MVTFPRLKPDSAAESYLFRIDYTRRSNGEKPGVITSNLLIYMLFPAFPQMWITVLATLPEGNTLTT